jgi:hypothetical protein
MNHSARLLIAATLIFAAGCAKQDWIDRTLVTENVTGAWAGSSGAGSTHRFVQLDLQHQGARVTGSIRILPEGASGPLSPGPIEGNVAGDVFTFKDARGNYSGELTVGGDEMTGRVVGPLGATQVFLRRTGSPSLPNPPPR